MSRAPTLGITEKQGAGKPLPLRRESVSAPRSWNWKPVVAASIKCNFWVIESKNRKQKKQASPFFLLHAFSYSIVVEPSRKLGIRKKCNFRNPVLAS